VRVDCLHITPVAAYQHRVSIAVETLFPTKKRARLQLDLHPLSKLHVVLY